MEAVGQLTGGVAHDFNNLLTVVLGNVDLLSRKLDGDPRMQRQLGAIRHAADRGRSLTRQLLAFSRRQHLSPVTLNVNTLVETFVPLLQQAVGEAVVLRSEMPDEPLCVHADAAQLETALLNLAVNARDAMPEGGDLVIRAGRVPAAEAPQKVAENGDADWVCVDVADTGEGIDPDVLERVFEPFFTTKEVGKGSGLGLSQVYGFVRQSGGFVTADSKVGQGTRFRLYLPISVEAPTERPAAPGPTTAARGRSERILVVEDDAPVLALTVDMLTGLGYRVVTAEDAPSALQVLKSSEPVDLMFSDVVMPGGISGVQLAHLARELRPGIKVLLTSGYVGEAAQGEEFELMDKPYERVALANKVREMLDAPAAPQPTKRKRQKASVAS
jgi:CheY-like chemotaxis protein